MLHNRVNRRLLKEQLQTSQENRTTLSFYRYVNIENVQSFRNEFYLLLEKIGVLGRIYLADEGINGQISVPKENFQLLRETFESIPYLKNLRLNVAVEAEGKSFFALTIKVRKKIVADGIDDPTFDASKCGTHLSAAEFNALTDRDDVILVDMRNGYESEVGHFEKAITPKVETFREELPLVAEMLAEKKDRPVVMYCTGGIRCEKASAYMLHHGFKEVYQLEGGIIEYARQVQAQGLKNKFLGKNFVFDERLGERVSEHIIAHCHQCGAPCDDHYNCANDFCHQLFIQCPECRAKYEACCSIECRDFNHLPLETRKIEGKNRIFTGTYRRRVRE